MKKNQLLSLVCAALFFMGCGEKPAGVVDLAVELQENPIGLDEQHPRFGWRIESDQDDVMQTSYRIMVAPTKTDLDKAENLVWDSGVVSSDQSTFVPYAGSQLESRKDYYWKVLITTNKGDSLWSDAAQWSMALLDDGDWQAQWIGIDSSLNATDRLTGDSRLAARYLRKEFPVEGNVASARLYISGLGFYECYLNGRKINEDIFAPTATDYTKSVNYNVFDVMEFLKDKQNTIGVILGNGRYFSMRLGDPSAGLLGSLRQFGYPKLLAQLEITYKDGSKTVVVSDDSWKLTTNGPIIANNEFDGEEYNANYEMKGWNENGFDDSAWMQARKVGAPGGELVAQRNPNIMTMDTVDPVSINQLNDSTYIVDMGQNLVGWLAVTLKGQKDKPIKMRFSETLKDDGSLYMDNLRGAHVTDIYTPASDGLFSWEPRFTYHGFRFVEITGLNYKPELKNFKGKVNYDRMETVGSFESSDSTINQIFHNGFRSEIRRRLRIDIVQASSRKCRILTKNTGIRTRHDINTKTGNQLIALLLKKDTGHLAAINNKIIRRLDFCIEPEIGKCRSDTTRQCQSGFHIVKWCNRRKPDCCIDITPRTDPGSSILPPTGSLFIRKNRIKNR